MARVLKSGIGDEVGLMDLAQFGVPFWATLLLACVALGVAAVIARRWRRAQAALLDSAEQVDRLEAFVAASSDWTWEHDADLRFTFISDSIQAVLGIPAADCIGKTRWELLPDAMSASTLATHRAILERHEPFRDLHQSIVTADGSERHYTLDGDPVFDRQGRFRGYRGVGRDVTRLTRVERAAADTRERFMSAIDARSEGISFWDPDGHLRFFNSAFLELSPGSEAYLHEGTHFDEYVRGSVYNGAINDAVGREEEWIAERIARRAAAPSTFEVRRGDRSLQATEFRTADGWILHTAYDITEVKMREAALRQAVADAEIANRAKLEFLAVMSHELRTPLNAIIGFSDVIRNQVLGEEMDTYARYADHIHESGTHLLALITDLLDVARIEAGRLELEESEFSLLQLTEECLRMLRVRADDKDVVLNLDVSDPSVGLRADRRAVKQIILNLLSNAIKFTEAGGRVRVRFAVEDDTGVAMSVADTGIGIPLDQQEAIFRPFEQLENAHTRRHDGTGLGLFITRNLVEAHGGKIRLESEIGVGTTVTVVFTDDRLVEIPGMVSAAAVK